VTNAHVGVNVDVQTLRDEYDVILLAAEASDRAIWRFRAAS